MAQRSVLRISRSSFWDIWKNPGKILGQCPIFMFFFFVLKVFFFSGEFLEMDENLGFGWVHSRCSSHFHGENDGKIWRTLPV